MKPVAWQQLALLPLAVRAKQPTAPEPIPAPLRDLQFGDLNFLHTTDTHGWHAGHLLEPAYSADWGDFVDFSARLREKLEAAGRDLILVDTGDRVEGNGLYDSSSPSGKYTYDIFKNQAFDLICSGNHELYKQKTSEADFQNLVPHYGTSYLASNIDIRNPETGQWQPLAARTKRFKTKMQGIQITAFGFIFDFRDNANNTNIITVREAIKQDWFRAAVSANDTDLFVVIGHSGVRSEEFTVIHTAIRQYHPRIPIQFFGGHYHVRDYRKFDDTAYGLASGRYLETIGFQSISNISTSNSNLHSRLGPNSEGNSIDTPTTPSWFRRYIDNNLYSFYHHSGHNASTFHSEKGHNISKQIDAARRTLNLDETFGCAPHDLWMTREPFPSNQSIYSWLNDTVLPEVVYNKGRAGHNRLILANTGGIRFDIFKGAFTRDSTYIVSPFTSGMNYIQDVPLVAAMEAVRFLNGFGKLSNSGASEVTDEEADKRNENARGYPSQTNIGGLDLLDLAPPTQRFMSKVTAQRLEHYYHGASVPNECARSDEMGTKGLVNLTQGYTTIDDAGLDGDDTLHARINTYPIPNLITSLVPSSDRAALRATPQPPIKPVEQPEFSDSQHRDGIEQVDLVFNAFLTPYVLLALQSQKYPVTPANVTDYMPGWSMTALLSKWISANWGNECTKPASSLSASSPPVPSSTSSSNTDNNRSGSAEHGTEEHEEGGGGGGGGAGGGEQVEDEL